MEITVTSIQFRSQQNHFFEMVQPEPGVILSDGSRPRAVVVSPGFYERASQALEDSEGIRAA